MMILAILAAGILQDLIPGLSWLGQMKLPLLLSVALYYAVYHPRGVMLAAALAAGIVQDSLSLMPIGYSALCFCALGLVVQRLRGVLFRHSAATALLVGGCGNALATALLQWMLGLDAAYSAGPGWWFALRLAGALLVGMLVTPLVWWSALRLDQLVGNLETQEA
jgi:rod shape-determining protein MreD